MITHDNSSECFLLTATIKNLYTEQSQSTFNVIS